MDEDEDLDLFPLVPQEQEIILDGNPDGLSIIAIITSKGKEQKLIFADLMILFLYFIVIMLYAIVTHSQSCISTAFVQLLHSILLGITLFSDYYSTIGPDEKHTYGYARSVIICCFTVSFIIILLAFSLLQEAIKKFMLTSKSETKEYKSIDQIIPNIVIC